VIVLKTKMNSDSGVIEHWSRLCFQEYCSNWSSTELSRGQDCLLAIYLGL